MKIIRHSGKGAAPSGPYSPAVDEGDSEASYVALIHPL
jgi:hypothetical protein